jgi:rhodanese-related sulfurtransferase
MAESAFGGRESGGRAARGIAVILCTGIALGLGYNALGRAGNPARGLGWIAEEKKLDSLAEASHAPAAAPSPGLPEIPDLDRPLQVDLGATRRFFDAKAALFVDAREADEYAEGHIPGALSLPFDTSVTDPVALEALDPAGKALIVYCGGGTCELSMNLAFALVQAGHKKVLVYMGGYPEWQGAGLPVEKGSAKAEAR